MHNGARNKASALPPLQLLLVLSSSIAITADDGWEIAMTLLKRSGNEWDCSLILPCSLLALMSAATQPLVRHATKTAHSCYRSQSCSNKKQLCTTGAIRKRISWLTNRGSLAAAFCAN